ncbi:uncharacterized protein LOC121385647 [Gigantopelta aegis]|uniref:uncharacterized protein LOC121385647 n=1 Tax=Gigantopelta aegis TaxID=1735272 RepID=UPI001B88A871|nr:uncharacterized protein LOC121385647 [Gigantopelta aegis]
MKKVLNTRVNVSGFRVHVFVWVCVAALVAATESVMTLGKSSTNHDEMLALLERDGLIPVSHNTSKTEKSSVTKYTEHFQAAVPEVQKQTIYSRDTDFVLDMETDFLIPAGPLLQRKRRQVLQTDLVIGSGGVPAEGNYVQQNRATFRRSSAR